MTIASTVSAASKALRKNRSKRRQSRGKLSNAVRRKGLRRRKDRRRLARPTKKY